jgi:hypothetical protein
MQQDKYKMLTKSGVLTINAPLILKMRDIIFFCGQTTLWAISPHQALQLNGKDRHEKWFKGYFEGAKTFLTPKLSRAQRGAIGIWCIGIFMSLLCYAAP